MKKKIITAAVLLFTLGIVMLLNAGTSPQTNNKLIVSMATDVGGLGDKSFNDGCWEGLELAAAELGLEARFVESKQQTDYVPNLVGLAEDGSQVVFGIGFLMADAIMEASKYHPDVYFGGIDIFVDPANMPENIQGMNFKEQEGGYLVGIVAGLLTKKYASAFPQLNDANVVGAVLGMDIPPCERYLAGYYAGIKSVNPDCKVLTVIAGAFDDQAKGKEATIALAGQGADIVFQIAGLTGLGVITGAKEKNIFAIGVDVDQHHLAPDTVITSALKNVSRATYLMVKDVVEGNFQNGNKFYSIKDDGTGIAPFHSFDQDIPAEIKAAVEQATQDLKDGSLVPPASRQEAGITN